MLRNEDMEKILLQHVFTKIQYLNKISEGRKESQSIQNNGGDNFIEDEEFSQS